ncbi:beta-ketoacyl reductase [Chondrus crispus]|uniref:Beta-ketoacyl reductase n=1 Tax=Chondrus crispus TaxID=2769 RepID=R7QTN1_CHOCR|nr:beta-ketoacyl reductase [Chondrus crispus]CDF41048.1 beta-ketoacyl reductase [Chondrus crispus]|eukprot:XP_005711342.1 beta-ketoacyl reductase [Chondrus crispus]
MSTQIPARFIIKESLSLFSSVAFPLPHPLLIQPFSRDGTHRPAACRDWGCHIARCRCSSLPLHHSIPPHLLLLLEIQGRMGRSHRRVSRHRRGLHKMDIIASEVSSTYGVKTHVTCFDFGSADLAAYAALKTELAPLAPKILVNNVGVNVEFPTDFVEMDPADVDRIVRINITSINKMTAMLLPAMIAAKKGIVFCLSSGGGAVTPAPLLAPYSGTKSYADSFAVSLSGEVVDKGVQVCSLTPFFVESAMAKMRKSFTVPSANDFANKALNQVCVSPRVSPHWVHAIMAGAVTLLPLKAQVSYVTNLHRSIRTRALKKKERLAKEN